MIRIWIALAVTLAVTLATTLGWDTAQAQERQTKPTPFRVGIIGLDTSHAIAFTKIINNAAADSKLARYRVVAAYPQGSRDIESSVRRVPGYTAEMQSLGVEIVPSIEQLLERVDAVLLETNDGRPHLEQAIPVLKAGLPLFIDKPVAGSLADTVAIYKAAEWYRVPVFSSSGLRFGPEPLAVRSGKLGEVLGADVYSPCSLEPTHPDLYWYGIHGVEMLFTVMGTGCEQVLRVTSPHSELVVGQWSGGRIGTFRGLRSPVQGGYGGTAFGTKGAQALGGFAGYEPLVESIVEFFDTGKPPVSAAETLEIYAFMSAADESKRQEGPVLLAPLLEEAEREAERRLAELGVAKP